VALLDGDWFESIPPRLEVADHRGAGDSMTAALAVARGQGLEAEDALRLATAAGCLNVTRHGLATGHRDTIERLAEQVEIRELPDALRRRRRDAPPTPSRG
jgi:1-phosphofructokinase